MTNSAPKIVRPSIQYEASYTAASYEHIAADDDIMWNPEISSATFQQFVERILSYEHKPPSETAVPASFYWLIVEGNTYAGEMNIRHYLNDSLKRYGGHIGYRVRPSQRRKGYGKLLCAYGVKRVRELGVRDILITCDDDNIGSQKIIEANGGVLKDKVDNNRGVLTRRYWIYGDDA